MNISRWPVLSAILWHVLFAITIWYLNPSKALAVCCICFFVALVAFDSMFIIKTKRYSYLLSLISNINICIAAIITYYILIWCESSHPKSKCASDQFELQYYYLEFGRLYWYYGFSTAYAFIQPTRPWAYLFTLAHMTILILFDKIGKQTHIAIEDINSNNKKNIHMQPSCFCVIFAAKFCPMLLFGSLLFGTIMFFNYKHYPPKEVMQFITIWIAILIHIIMICIMIVKCSHEESKLNVRYNNNIVFKGIYIWYY